MAKILEIDASFLDANQIIRLQTLLTLKFRDVKFYRFSVTYCS